MVSMNSDTWKMRISMTDGTPTRLKLARRTILDYPVTDMIDLSSIQKDILANKIAKGFNTTDMNEEFIHTFEELAEATAAYRKKLPDLGEELADVMIYLLGIAEILGIDLGREIVAKMEKNRKREYLKIDGVPVRTKEG